MFLPSWLRVCAPLIMLASMCDLALGVGTDYGVSSPADIRGDGDVLMFRFADDIDTGGLSGSIPIVVVLPDGTVSIAVIHDFDDIHTFDVSYDSASLVNLPNSGAIDVASVIWLDDDSKGSPNQSNISPWRAADALRARDWQFTGHDRGVPSPMASHSSNDFDAPPELSTADHIEHSNGVGIIYGVRAIQRSNSQSIMMLSRVLPNVYLQTDADNEILGPQIGVVLARRFGRLSTRLQATVLAGFNFGDVNQRGNLDRDLVPGALNQPLVVSSKSFHHDDRHDEFSPSGELRAEARYRLRENVTLSLAWSGIAIGNALLAEDRLDYTTPEFGLTDPGEQSILVHNLYCGLEFVL